MQESRVALLTPFCSAPRQPGQRGRVAIAQSQRAAANALLDGVFFLSLSHFPAVDNVIAGLLGVSGYFAKKCLCYLSDQGAYNPFSKVAEELKNVNLIIRGNPVLHFSKRLPQLSDLIKNNTAI